MQRGYSKLNGTGTIVSNSTVRVEVPTAELLMRGRELIRYLRRYGESVWAEWLEEGLETVHRDARSGVVELLDGFGGIGGLTEIYLCPEAGHRLEAREELEVNEELLQRVSRVFELARNLGDLVGVDSGELARRPTRW